MVDHGLAKVIQVIQKPTLAKAFVFHEKLFPQKLYGI